MLLSFTKPFLDMKYLVRGAVAKMHCIIEFMKQVFPMFLRPIPLTVRLSLLLMPFPFSIPIINLPLPECPPILHGYYFPSRLPVIFLLLLMRTLSCLTWTVSCDPQISLMCPSWHTCMLANSAASSTQPSSCALRTPSRFRPWF